MTVEDLRIVAPMALRQRQTETASDYFKVQEKEDKKIRAVLEDSKTAQKRLKKSGQAVETTPATPSPTLPNGHAREEEPVSSAPETPDSP